MGWLIAIALTVVGLINHDSLMICGAGIFAMASSISVLAEVIKGSK